MIIDSHIHFITTNCDNKFVCKFIFLADFLIRELLCIPSRKACLQKRFWLRNF